jgi:biotin-[acetyl-CoA-carboxylase] ligase BirA-like protein
VDFGKFQYLEECTSTNDVAREQALLGAPHGYWISAGKQTAGRGQKGRSWVSEPGNLLMSLILRKSLGALATWIPIAAGVSVIRALAPIRPGVQVQIKWPNDLLIQGSKVGGILCEGTTQGADSFVIVGIGVNTSQVPEVLDRAVTALDIDSQELAVLREGIARELLREVDRLAQVGQAELKMTAEELSIFAPGDLVTWGNGSGEWLGLGEFGELRVQVRDLNGSREVRLFSEEISGKLRRVDAESRS